MIKEQTVHKQEKPITEGNKQPSQTGYRWVILALIWFLYFACTLVSRSMAPLVTPIIKDINVSYSQMGFILGAWSLVYIVVSVMGGAFIDKWGIRKCLFIGIVIVGISEILRYFANGFIAMFLFVALFGLGGPMITIGSPKTVALWFTGKERGTGVAIYMTGARIGEITAYSLTNSVIMPLTGNSWRLTFVYYGLVVLVIALVWLVLGRDAKSTATEAKAATAKTSMIKVFRNLIGMRSVQLIFIMGFLSLAIGHSINDWLPKILENGGLPPVVAGYAASVPILVGMPLSLVALRLIPPNLRGLSVALGALLLIIALVMVVTTSGVSLVIGLVLYGIAHIFGMPFLILMLMDMPEVGSRYMGSAGGLYFCIAHIGGFAGPLMIGTLVDFTGSFMVGVILLAGMSLAMSVIALFLKTAHIPKVVTPA
ncbi:MAG: MFS transporter [Chloroflexota bacterium]